MFNNFINNKVNSDEFISDNIEFDENTSIYKCNNLNDCLKACDELTLTKKHPSIVSSFKKLKKYVIHPIELVYSKSEIIFIPQIYDILDGKMKLALKKILIYIWNLQCSNKLKKSVTEFAVREYFKQMSKSQTNNVKQTTPTINANIMTQINHANINYTKKPLYPKLEQRENKQSFSGQEAVQKVEGYQQHNNVVNHSNGGMVPSYGPSINQIDKLD